VAQVLQDLSKSQKVVPAIVEFVDIAGLVKGASKGEGLGNKFLSHIRSVDCVVQVGAHRTLSQTMASISPFFILILIPGIRFERLPGSGSGLYLCGPDRRPAVSKAKERFPRIVALSKTARFRRGQKHGFCQSVSQE
jgi:hypothetical protein